MSTNEALAHARKVAERGLEAHKGMGREVQRMAQGQPGQGCPVRPSEGRRNCRKASTRPLTTLRPPSKSARVSPLVRLRLRAQRHRRRHAGTLGRSADLGGSNKTDLKRCHLRSCRVRPPKQWPVCSPYAVSCTSACASSPWAASPTASCWLPHPSVRRHLLHVLRLRAFRRSLAALMQIPNLYIWSHDSVAVGEDGPTHQPVEHLASFRAIPQLESFGPPMTSRPPRLTVTSSRRRTPCLAPWF